MVLGAFAMLFLIGRICGCSRATRSSRAHRPPMPVGFWLVVCSAGWRARMGRIAHGWKTAVGIIKMVLAGNTLERCGDHGWDMIVVHKS